jgi:hypothetical protein
MTAAGRESHRSRTRYSLSSRCSRSMAAAAQAGGRPANDTRSIAANAIGTDHSAGWPSRIAASPGGRPRNRSRPTLVARAVDVGHPAGHDRREPLPDRRDVPAGHRVHQTRPDQRIDLGGHLLRCSAAVDRVQAQLAAEHAVGLVDLLGGQLPAGLTRGSEDPGGTTARHHEGDVQPARLCHRHDPPFPTARPTPWDARPTADRRCRDRRVYDASTS